MTPTDIRILLDIGRGRISGAAAAAIASDLDGAGHGDLLAGLHRATDPQNTHLILAKHFAKQGISLCEILEPLPSPNFDEVLDSIYTCLGQFGTVGLDGEIWIGEDDYGSNEICVEMHDGVYAEQAKWSVAIQSALVLHGLNYTVIVTNRDRPRHTVRIGQT